MNNMKNNIKSQTENLKTNVKNIAEKNGFKFIDMDNIFLNKKKGTLRRLFQ